VAPTKREGVSERKFEGYSEESTMPTMVRVNLGGEGEVPDVLNQNGPWIAKRGWKTSLTRKSLWQLVQLGHRFLICENLHLPIADGSVDEVITNSMPPVDTVTYLGPTVQFGEIRRILKAGGQWIDDGTVVYTKP
jgi:hypothetical protein